MCLDNGIMVDIYLADMDSSKKHVLFRTFVSITNVLDIVVSTRIIKIM